MPDTPTQSNDRQLYESQLRLNGALLNDMEALKRQSAEQAERLAEILERDSVAARLASGQNDFLIYINETIQDLQGTVIGLLEADGDRDAAARKALDGRVKAATATRRMGQLADRMDPASR